MKYDIQTIENSLYKLLITITNDVSFDDFTIYGICKRGCCCHQLEVSEKGEKSCVIVVPALHLGIYDYQLFAKQITTNTEHLLLQGKVIVDDRIGNENGEIEKTVEISINADNTTIEATIEQQGIIQGADGGYYIPAVSADGNLSWTALYGDMPPVDTVNIRGPQGEKGEKGDRGEQGIQGIQGVQGIQGERGLQGEKGDKGDRGERGLQGLLGIQGERGLQGEKGDKGDRGERGLLGLLGIQGERGEQGIQGIQGVQGIQGEQGEDGGYYIPDVSADGNLSWTATKDDMPPVATVNIKGEKGDSGGLDWASNENGVISFDTTDTNFSIEETTLRLVNNGTSYFVSFEELAKLAGVYIEEIESIYKTKYANCVSISDVSAINSDYQNDLVDGAWLYDLSSLTVGTYMFQSRTNLTSFSGDLSSLTNGTEMFRDCTSLTSFLGDLSNLTNPYRMFFWCSGLTSFEGDLSKLTNGRDMFRGCTNLTSFRGNLSSLTSGGYIFGHAATTATRLDLASVQHIAQTINTVSSGSILIGISSSIQGNADLEAALAAIRAKGWTVNTIYH